MKLRNPGARRVLPPVHPNVGVTVWYRQQLDTLIQLAHLDLVLRLGMAWEENPPDIGFAQDAPSAIRNIDRTLKEWGKQWAAKFDKMSDRIADQFAAKSFRATDAQMREQLKRAGFAINFKPTKQSLEAYRAVVAENVNLIKSIQSHYLTQVQSDVWQSVNKGADMAKLSRTLHERYGSTVKRAALIARDQNAKAKAVLENTRRQQLGITHAIWQHSSAGKEPRPTHVAMNGKRFELKKGMYDSDEGEWIWPGQLINCRCTSRAIIPGVTDDD